MNDSSLTQIYNFDVPNSRFWNPKTSSQVLIHLHACQRGKKTSTQAKFKSSIFYVWIRGINNNAPRRALSRWISVCSRDSNASKDYYSIKGSQLKEFYISVLDSFLYGKIFAQGEILRGETTFFLQKTSIENILQLFKCLNMERQITICSSSSGNILEIGEGLLGFLGSLKWQNMYVPCCLWEYLHALMPYIVGMNSKEKTICTRHFCIFY